jgi:hypothetical protein
MEMEDHHQYGIADLRQLMNGTRSHFPSIPEPQDLFSSHHHHHHRNLTPTQHQHQQQQQHYEMMMLGRQQVPTPPPPPPEMLQRGLHDFRVDNSTSTTPTITSVAATTTATTSTPSLLSGLDTDTGCLGGDASTGRWPRQETLTLLEIRSRLDPKFKEANQKGPLWDEVSRYIYLYIYIYTYILSTLIILFFFFWFLGFRCNFIFLLLMGFVYFAVIFRNLEVIYG